MQKSQFTNYVQRELVVEEGYKTELATGVMLPTKGILHARSIYFQWNPKLKLIHGALLFAY